MTTRIPSLSSTWQNRRVDEGAPATVEMPGPNLQTRGSTSVFYPITDWMPAAGLHRIGVHAGHEVSNDGLDFHRSVEMHESQKREALPTARTPKARTVSGRSTARARDSPTVTIAPKPTRNPTKRRVRRLRNFVPLHAGVSSCSCATHPSPR